MRVSGRLRDVIGVNDLAPEHAVLAGVSLR
jgi:hypothetical protein